MVLEKGDTAPGFTLKNSEGNSVSLSDFSGKKVVLYFYPKNFTPGCTTQICDFRDYYQDILDTGAVVIGVSSDSSKSHKNFKEKYDGPFTLLSDPDKKVIKSYGALKSTPILNKTSLGIQRSTFIIAENQKIIKVYPKVSPKGHAKEVLNFLKSLQD